VRRVLNVGGGSRTIPIPSVYDGWEHVLLDINPDGNPDIVLDARQLSQLPGAEYDAVYCAHNLEHYYRHEASVVLAGIHHVLKADGFANIVVPDLAEVMQIVVRYGLDIDDVLYQSQAGPILVRDVFFGFSRQVEQAGNLFYAHKTGFTQKSLTQILTRCGFLYVFARSGNLEVAALAFKDRPTEFALKLLNLSLPPAR
jgi:hypothetical protein